MHGARAAGWLSVFALVLGTATAQARRPLVGVVLGAAGEPLAGAEVTLAHTAYGSAGGADVDVVRAVSDARGYFIAKLLPQQVYSAWAMHRGDDGATLVSPVLEDVAAGGRAQLRCGSSVGARHLRCAGLAAWNARGPLRLQVGPASANAVRFDLGEDGVVPPLPRDLIAYAIDSAGGIVAQQRLAAELAEPPFDLPAPMVRQLQVFDPSGRPVAGAAVFHIVDNPVGTVCTGLFDRDPLPRERLVGHTDADGRVLCVVPQLRNSGLVLEVRRDGFAAALLQESLSGEVFVVDRRRPGCGEQTMPLELQPAAHLQVLRDGAAVPGALLQVVAVFNAGATCERAVSVRSDGAGMAALPLRTDPAQAMVQIAANGDRPEAFVRIDWSSGAVSKLNLECLRRLSLQVLDEGGGPATGLAGVIVPVGGANAVKLRAPISTDQAGRCERLLGGDRWFLLFADADRWLRLDIPAHREKASRTLDITVRCRGTAKGRLQFADAKNNAIAGATVSDLSVSSSRVWLAGDAAQQIWGPLLPGISRRLAQRFVSDSSGLLEFPLLDDPSATWWVQTACTPTRTQVGNGAQQIVRDWRR
ncbi:MAG: carboxypeptidase regulatory-like domain-containing protein [Planctomycetes bacterium]|nr:carboxypeptidase regulatory-like domain-containing protein [Planctomycetota bacterium]